VLASSASATRSARSSRSSHPHDTRVVGAPWSQVDVCTQDAAEMALQHARETVSDANVYSDYQMPGMSEVQLSACTDPAHTYDVAIRVY